MILHDAIIKTIDECLSKDIFVSVLTKYKNEVAKMSFWEFNEEDAKAYYQNEGREEGRIEGRIEGQEQMAITVIRNTIANTGKSFDEVCQMMGIPNEDKEKYRLTV